MFFNSRRASRAETMLRMSLLGGAALGALAAMPASAQTTTAATPAAEDQATDTVVVLGQRPLAESEAAALAIQRESDSVVSVLSADGIGNLPDQNLAFAISRLPGIGIERDQGQARYVNLRGTPNYWTTLSFDGLPIVSPEGRSTRFDNIPSALSKDVIVTKAITPNMPGDTVAGNVNVVTRSAFDNDGFSLKTKLGAGYVTLGGGEEVDTTMVVSDRFLDGRLGVLLQGSYYRRNMVTDNWETDPYLSDRDSGGLFYAREHENKLYRLTRENQSLSFRLDYELGDNSTIFWNNVWTNYTDEELRSNYIFRLDQGTGAAGTTYSRPATGNTALSGTSYGARINHGANSLESEEDIYTSTLGGDHELEGWDVSWRGNFTYTADGRDAPALPAWQSPSTFTDRPTIAYDFTDIEDHRIQLFRTGGTTGARVRGVPVNSIEDFPLTFVSIARSVGGNETRAYTLKGDVGRDFQVFGTNLEFDAGILYTDRSKKSAEETWTATRAQLVAAGVAVPEVTSAGPTAAWNSLFIDKEFLGKLVVPYNFRYHSKTALEAFALDMQLRGIATKTDTTANYWQVGEEITAGYAMGKLDMDWGNIVFGARVEQFKNEGQAVVEIGTPRARMVHTSSDDVLVYPSVHVNYDINDEMKLRVGLTTSASRPDFDDLRPNFTFSDANQTVSGGNPEAQPEKQKGIDIYYEWYMEPEGFLSAGFFYKDISDFLFTESRVFGSDVLDFNGTTRSGYTFTGLDNGGDGHLQGFEVFYSKTLEDFVTNANLPDWLGGFGLRASATFTTSEVDANGRKVKLPGTSAGVYNLQAIYERYGLSMRLAYQFRTHWIQSLGADANGDTWWDDDEEIDFSMRYRVNDNLEWFFDAANIGDKPAIRYVGTPTFPIEHEQFGARYMTGIRVNF